MTSLTGSARVRLKFPETKKYITWEVAMVFIYMLYVFIMLYDDLFNHRILKQAAAVSDNKKYIPTNKSILNSPKSSMYQLRHF